MAPRTGPALLGRALGRARDVSGIVQAPVLALAFNHSRFVLLHPVYTLHINTFTICFKGP